MDHACACRMPYVCNVPCCFNAGNVGLLCLMAPFTPFAKYAKIIGRCSQLLHEQLSMLHHHFYHSCLKFRKVLNSRSLSATLCCISSPHYFSYFSDFSLIGCVPCMHACMCVTSVHSNVSNVLYGSRRISFLVVNSLFSRKVSQIKSIILGQTWFV